MGIQEKQEKISKLKGRVESFENAIIKRISTFEDRIEEVEAANERLREEIAQLREEIEQVREENEALRAEIEMLRARVSVTEPDDGWNETKREVCRRIGRTALWNRAQNNDGKAQMRYKDVMNALVDNGVENVHPPECYRAMEDMAATDGFELTTDGNDEKVIRLDISETPVEEGFVISGPAKSGGTNATASVNRINNGGGADTDRTNDQDGGEHNQG